MSRDSWLVDGNYSFVRDLFWPHTTQVVWLNYSFPIIFRRALKRSLRRSLTGEKLYADNTETLALTFFHRESILCWIIKSFRRRAPRDQNIYPNLTSTGLRTPAAAERFLDTVSSRAELQTN